MKRDRTIKVRVSQQELAFIEAKATEKNRRLSSYVRDKAITGQLSDRSARELLQTERIRQKTFQLADAIKALPTDGTHRLKVLTELDSWLTWIAQQ
jgi:hypothetical protein